MVAKHTTCNWSLIAVKIVKVYRCDVCHKHTEKSSKLRLGSAVVQDVADCSQGYFRCGECKKSFGQKASLLVHRRKHSEIKPYVCVKCNIHFITQAGLVIHKARHELQVKIEDLYNEVNSCEVESVCVKDELKLDLSSPSKDKSNLHGVSEGTAPDNYLVSQKYNPQINAQLTCLENGTLSLTLQQDNNQQPQKESVGSEMCFSSTSQNVVGQFVMVQIGNQSKLVLLRTPNSSRQSSTTGLFTDKPVDCNKTNNIVSGMVSPAPVCIDTSDHKFAHAHWLKSNENIMANQLVRTLPDVSSDGVVTDDNTSTLPDVSSDGVVTDDNISTLPDVSSDRAVIDDNISTLPDVYSDRAVIDDNISTLPDVYSDRAVIDDNISTLPDVSSGGAVIDDNISTLPEVSSDRAVIDDNISTLPEVSSDRAVIDDSISTLPDIASDRAVIDDNISTLPDVSSDRAVIDDNISNNGWLKRETPDSTNGKKTRQQREHQTDARFSSNSGSIMAGQSNSSPNLSNVITNHADFIPLRKLDDRELKENKIDTNSRKSNAEGRYSKLKTKSYVQHKDVLNATESCTRVLTGSLVKKKEWQRNEKHCVNMQESQHEPEISRMINKPKTNKSNTKTMVIGSVEEDAYNVEADSIIKNDLKQDGVKKVLYFQCSMCPTKHLSELDLANHEKLHFVKKSKLFQCDICKKMYIEPAKLREHRRLHTGEKPFICKICPKSFRVKSSLTVHSRVHSGDTPFHCRICSKVFACRNVFRRHKESHKSDSDARFKCKTCGIRYQCRQSLVNHNKTFYKCDICAQLFCTLSQLSRHKSINHAQTFSVCKSDGKYCQFCDKTFKTNYSFYDHIQYHSEQGISIMFPCPDCSESFDSFDSLHAHEKTHAVKVIKYICCPYSHCIKTFTCQVKLDLHVKKHNGERKYLCYRCGKYFTDGAFYSKHKSTCPKVKKVICKLCGKSLSGYSSVKQHARVHSGEKRHQCETCGVRFKEVHHLRRHILIHVRKGEVSLLKTSNTIDSNYTVSCYTSI